MDEKEAQKLTEQTISEPLTENPSLEDTIAQENISEEVLAKKNEPIQEKIEIPWWKKSVTWFWSLSNLSKIGTISGTLVVLGLPATIPDIISFWKEHCQTHELRIYSDNPSTIAQDNFIKLDIEEKSKGCEYKKERKNNKLILVVKCSGKKGDTINFTAYSEKCPKIIDIGVGELAGEATFKVKCMEKETTKGNQK